MLLDTGILALFDPGKLEINSLVALGLVGIFNVAKTVENRV